ncbi:hypothetical protein BBJ29_008826, partial [Phytophthora kernoviae]
YVHEKRKDVKRVSIAELLSHQVNEGVDNTGNIRTWPSEQILLSYLLSSRVCSQVQRRDQRGELLPVSCCELGGGMAGLASLGLLARASVQLERVLVTDGNPLCVKNLQLCVDENKAQQAIQGRTEVAAELLRWDRHAPLRQDLQHQFDLVFASDCLFFEEFHEDLAHTIKSLLRAGSGRCLLLQPSRNKSMERFCVVAERYGFTVHRSEDYDPTIVRKHTEYQRTRPDYVADVHLAVLLTLIIEDSRSNVRVCCRVRPQNAKELTMAGAQRCVATENDCIEVKKFTFDHVFAEETDQKAVFESVALPVVQDIMDGYNATIFAYGQTSSGKTYTMEGANIDHPELQGIIPRTATEIFNNFMVADENMEFIVKVSYIEIYMERIRDLLDPYKSKVNLQVREDAQRGIFVEGMTEMCVTSDEELLAAMRAGAANRAVAATGMNEGSSRSHSVFMVTLFQRNLENQATKAGKLYLVDLAGSEMVRKTGATGRQLEEAKTINKSLSALGMVINALTDSHVSHVPYRDSKLTRVLQESLGGNSRTALIINVSPSSFNAPETISTLRFGMRAKSIKNKAVVNEQRSIAEYEALLAAAEKKIDKQQTYIIALEARLVGREVPVVDGDGTDIAETTVSEDTPREAVDGVDQSADAANIELTFSDTAISEAPPSPSARAGRALAELQEKVNQLEEELAEEKQESMRRGEEIRSLTAKLEEHIQALETQRVLSEELQRVKELQEKTLEEKIRQRETLYSELRTDFDRLSFDHKELVIHSETLQSEYDVLLQDMPSQIAVGGGKLAAAAEKIATQAENQSTEREEKAPSSAGEGAAETQELTTESGASRDGVDSQQYLDLKTKYAALEAEQREYEKEYLALKHSADHEKARLQEDIDRKTAQIRELEERADRAGAATSESGSTPTSPNSTSGMSARERQHMRSIQQKLEQLVAVHRQLLRKYASLELELSEAKKKLTLRDERIKQVEANNRIMAGNMRAQAEKHVEELTHLRDQIADFRGAQRSHFEAQLNHTNAALVAAMGSGETSAIKTLRGGSIYGDGVIRPIRGGGRRKTMVGEAAVGTMGATGVAAAGVSDANAPSSGFLTRLFGKTN